MAKVKAIQKSTQTKNSNKKPVKKTQKLKDPILLLREKTYAFSHNLKLSEKNFTRLGVEDIYHDCVLKKLKKSSKSLEPHYDFIAQRRAVRAIEMGLGVQKPGYNIYVAGVQGTGKTSVIRSFLKRTAEKSTTPGDWVYVYNFKTPESPKALSLKQGEAKEFKKEMDQLVDVLASEIPGALQSEEYENKVNSAVNISNERKSKLFLELEKSAKSKNFGVKSTRMGIVTVPFIEGKPLSEKDYADLTEDQKNKIESERNLLEPEVLDFARKVRAIESETKKKLEELRSQVGDYVVSNAMTIIQKKYSTNKELADYLSEVKSHIMENLTDFSREEEDDDDEDESPTPQHQLRKNDPYLPYRVNVFVDNTETVGAPIVIENNPTFYNLFGKIEKNIEYGVYTTDFKMIKAGSLAKANGGYLVLNAMDVLRTPQVWETLKRVLKNQQLFIEDLGEQFSLLPTSGLRPAPINLNVKIVLIGSDAIYRVLYQHDEDFTKVFKIKADFDTQMSRSEENISEYVNFIFTRSQVDNLLPFSPGAVSAIIEFSSRIVEDQSKLSTRFSLIKDLTIESNFIAVEENQKNIERKHVEKAIEEKYTRSSLLHDHLTEMVEKGDIIISTDSRRVGEINALAVYNMGDISFGLPHRLTCRTYKGGKPGIVNIEREAALSGRIHNKGISILTGFISGTFAKLKPINLSASLCFEQNYSGVDGDSATLAELILVLCTSANIPLDQSIAVTGSVNQFGEVQPVGGINEKIEGFFRVCSLFKLNGRQGVIIPHQNIKNLMLNNDVRSAIKNEKFHIWPVYHVEEALEIMTGLKTGMWNEDKMCFEKDTAFDYINKSLHIKNDQSKTSKNKKRQT